MKNQRYLKILSAALTALTLFFSGCGKPVSELIRTDQTKISPEKEEVYKIAGSSGRLQAKKMHSLSGAPIMSEDNGFVIHNTEEYDRIYENRYKSVKESPVSTFSIDVDTASYSNLRRFISSSQIPPKDAVRIEEMINYFDYDYSKPGGEHPFSINTEISSSPWNSENRLIHIGIQGKVPDYVNVKPSNLVLLIDSSGSMSSPRKLPLLKKSLGLMLDKLGKKDRIAIVVYAGSAGLVLPSTPATEKEKILNAFDLINAGERRNYS